MYSNITSLACFRVSKVDEQVLFSARHEKICAWRDLPRKYGSATTCLAQVAEMEKDGTWKQIWRRLLDEKGAIDGSRGFLDGVLFLRKVGEIM